MTDPSPDAPTTGARASTPGGAASSRPRSRGRARLVAGALVVAALAAGGWYGWTQYAERKEAVEYRTAKVVRGPITASVAASGTLNAVTSVQVGSQVSGQIKEVLADFNSEVRKGQLIARIDPETFEYRVRQSMADVDAARAQVLTAQANVSAARAGVSRAEVNLAEARRDFDRKQSLVERNFISTAELEKARAVFNAGTEDLRAARAQLAVAEAQAGSAEAVVKQREAQLAQARVDLERTAIRAPVDGIVIKRSIDAGQTVAASLQAPELFIIARNLRDMQVDTSIDEAEIGKIRVGQRATFTVDSYPGRSFAGEVQQVRKAAQTVQNVVTYTVVVSAQNPDLALVPGMTANVRVVTETRESVLKVPNAALRFRPAGFQEPGAPAPTSRRDGSPMFAHAAGALLAVMPAAAAQPVAGPSGASPLAQFRERLDRELSPTPEQRAQLDAIFASMREKFAAAREAPEGERAALVERHRAELRERVAGVLTPEQKQRYAEIVAELAARPRGAGASAGATAPSATAGATPGKDAATVPPKEPPAPSTAAKDGTAPSTSKPRAAPAAAPAPAASKPATPPAAAPGTGGPAATGGPGGALRAFRERIERELALSEEQRVQLEAIFAGMRDKFAALREAPEADRPRLLERNRAELRERIADILKPEQKKRFAEIVAEIAGRQSTRGRVFLLGADGKPRPVDVRVGLTDGTYTEVAAEGLKEGDDVIIGTVSRAKDAPKAVGSTAPRMPF